MWIMKMLTEKKSKAIGNVNMLDNSRLYHLHKTLESKYKLYKYGLISEQKYLTLIKPIDLEIAELEMSILQDSLVLQEAFLPHTPRLKY
jgi:hypothetical protein